MSRYVFWAHFCLALAAMSIFTGCETRLEVPAETGTFNRVIPVNIQAPVVDVSEETRSISSKEISSDQPGILAGFDQVWRRALPVRVDETTTFTVLADAPGKLRFWLGTSFQNTETEKNIILNLTLSDGVKTLEHRISPGTDRHKSLKWSPTDVSVAPLSGSILVSCSIEASLVSPPDQSGIVYIGSPIFIPDTPEKRQPDVILLVIDSLRDRDTGMYGSNTVKTPLLDSLARISTQYSNALTSSSWTMPAVKNLMSGQYSNRFTSEGENLYRIRKPFPVIQEELARNGWYCAAISANHLITVDKGYERGFDCFDASPSLQWQHGSSELFLSSALTQLEECSGTPTFFYWHLMDPHDPYSPIEPFASECNAPADQEVRESLHTRETGHLNYETQGNSNRLRTIEKRYLHDYYSGEIRQVDTVITLIIEQLIAQDRFDDTLLIVTSDHGEEFGEHGFYQHGKTLFEEAVRIPLLIKPVGNNPGEHRRISPGWVSTIDLPQTICHLVDLTFPECSEGQNIFPVPGFDQTVFSLLHRRVRNRKGRTVWRAAYNGEQKVIWTNTHGWTGYNLSLYPGERYGETGGSDEEVQQLERFKPWRQLVTELQAFINEEEVGFDESSRNDKKLTQKLRQLGYIE